MLAKQMYIKHLKLQREYITGILSSISINGNASRIYIGDVFPEVIAYFMGEGYEFVSVENPKNPLGLPEYLIRIQKGIKLTPAEKRYAENLEIILIDSEEDDDDLDKNSGDDA